MFAFIAKVFAVSLAASTMGVGLPVACGLLASAEIVMGVVYCARRQGR